MNARNVLLWIAATLTMLIACGAMATSSSATIVSLGDSYSSGEGAPEFDIGTRWDSGNGCHRSGNAWPRQLGVEEENHFACSGAITDNFLTAQKDQGPDVFPQAFRLKALAESGEVSKVYMTIGGNDLGFADIIEECFKPSRQGCLNNLEETIFPRLENKVLPKVSLVTGVTKKFANGGDVILVGYPNIVPFHGALLKCTWMSDTERARLLRLQDRLDETLRRAAAAAGVAFVSVSKSLAGHELCTRNSWVQPVFSHKIVGLKRKDLFVLQAHPNERGQEAIARAVRAEENQGAGATPAPAPGCVPAGSVSSIIDDSGSMEESDPNNLRSSAMQLLITKPSGLSRTLGAVEFGTDAATLFSPSIAFFSQGPMLGALGNLQNDGVNGEAQTDYNDAFAAGTINQPNATARIFFTDGGHNQDDYLDGHRGGPRTYVVGLGIGPGGEGDETADLLRRIATETGGHYFPLLRGYEDDVENQNARIQPVFNAIDALLQCRTVPDQFRKTITKVNRPTRPVSSPYVGEQALEVVASWTDPNARIQLSSATVTGGAGKVVANLAGKVIRTKRGPHGKKKKVTHKVAQLQPVEVSGLAYSTIKIPRPPKGSSLNVTMKATSLPAATDVSIQIGPVAEETGQPAPPVDPPPPPPPPVKYMQQVTPNHGVNTFTNYHNASGMGPAIPAGTWVEVSCRVYDPFIGSVNPDGWWYRVASGPWNNSYYSPANVFMNGDPYGGPYLHNTDFAVPVC